MTDQVDGVRAPDSTLTPETLVELLYARQGFLVLGSFREPPLKVGDVVNNQHTQFGPCRTPLRVAGISDKVAYWKQQLLIQELDSTFIAPNAIDIPEKYFYLVEAAD